VPSPRAGLHPTPSLEAEIGLSEGRGTRGVVVSVPTGIKGSRARFQKSDPVRQLFGWRDDYPTNAIAAALGSEACFVSTRKRVPHQATFASLVASLRAGHRGRERPFPLGRGSDRTMTVSVICPVSFGQPPVRVGVPACRGTRMLHQRPSWRVSDCSSAGDHC
jgi:hypothetical protein